MSSTNNVRTRLLAICAAAALAGSMIVALAAPASADAVPPVTTPATPATVSADALPTVQIDGVVWAQVVVGNTVYAAGSFTTARPAGAAAGVNTTTRNNLLAYNITTGALITTFAPDLKGQALAVAASPDGKRLYVGGDFTMADGKTRSRIAAYDLTTNALVANFKPLPTTTVRAIVATNTTVYFGGDFGAVNGVTRNRLAAVDVATGNLLNWNPNADAPVTAMTMTTDGSKIVVGGRFANMGGNAWYGLAALDPTTGLTVPWAATAKVRDAGTQASITSLTASADGVYGTGYVYGAGGNLEGTFRADPATGNIIWIEDCHGDTYSVYAGNPDLVYVASHEHYCGNIGGFQQTPVPWATYRGTAFGKAATGTITADPLGYFNWAGNPSPTLLNWFPTFTTGSYTGQGQAGWSVTGNSKYIVYGGEFPSVNGTNQQGLVRFAIAGLAPNKIGPDSNDGLTPSVQVLNPGSVRVAWLATFDRDDVAITYKVYRDFKSLSDTPIYTTTASNTFWQRRNLGFVDTTAVAGQTYNYRVYAVDRYGNAVSRGATKITVPTTDSLGSQTYPDAVKADSPNTYWRLGESSATSAFDYIGFNDGVKATGVTQSTDGIVAGDANTASTFDGSAATISTQTAAPAPNTFSVEAWFKTNSTTGGKIIGYGAASSGKSGSYDRQVYLDNSGRVYFGVHPGSSQTVNSVAGFNDNQWHQVVATLGANGMQLFVDGKRVAARTDVTTGQAYSGYWRVGGDNLSGWPGQPSSFFLAGSIDEVAIYGSVLAAGQVNNHYVASGRSSLIAPRPADPYGQAVYDLGPDLFWRLDDAAGATVEKDLGPSGNSGNVGAGVTFGATGALTGRTTTAGQFSGSSSGAVVEQNPEKGTAVYSEGVWFKTTTQVGGKLIGFGAAASPSDTSSSYDRHVYLQNNGQVAFGTYTGQTNIALSPLSYNDGKWHFALATQGSNGMVLYLDGQPVATNPQTSAQNYTGYWRIGGDTTWNSSSAWFAGTLDEASVFPTTLTAAQVSGLYAAGASGPVNHAPVAAFTATATNLAVAFDAASSTDDGTIASYGWDFGDGSAAGSGVSPSHTFAAAGSYSVVLTVTDNGGLTNKVTKAVTVTAAPPVNQAPVAAFTATATNLAVAFDAASSTDDGTIASYGWDFGDGSAAGSGVSPSHTFAAAGSYSVVLTVTDNGGLTNKATKAVTVTAAPPAGAVPFAQDSFGRTVANGLGNADLGGAWTVSGTAGAYSVNGTAAKLAMTAPAATPTAALASVSSTTTDVRVDISTDKALTGSGAYLTLVGRRISSTSDYRSYLKINAAGQVTLVVSKRVSGTETVLSTKVVPGLTYTAGSPVTLRLQVSGTNSVLLNARVWKTGTTEPTAWQSSVSDATAALAGPGGLGLQAYLSGSATNAPVVATFDNLVAQPVN